jgi:hypothetical protein
VDYGLDFPIFFLLFPVIYNHELNNVINKDLFIFFPFDMVNYCTYLLCTEWQLPNSGVHSIKMENQPWLVRVGVHAHPLSLGLPSLTDIAGERADTYPNFISTLYVLCAPFFRYLISTMV